MIDFSLSIISKQTNFFLVKVYKHWKFHRNQARLLRLSTIYRLREQSIDFFLKRELIWCPNNSYIWMLCLQKLIQGDSSLKERGSVLIETMHRKLIILNKLLQLLTSTHFQLITYFLMCKLTNLDLLKRVLYSCTARQRSICQKLGCPLLRLGVSPP